jgi:hypothetical protein
LTEEAIEWLAVDQGDTTDWEVNELARNGVLEATTLARVMALHGRPEVSHAFLVRATDLTFVYGNHKDILLHDYINTIELLAASSGDAACGELAPVVAVVLHLGDPTDGGETDHVPGLLFDLLAGLRPEWLAPVCRRLCEEEQYHDAADCFQRIVRSLDLDSPINGALARTAIEDGCQSELAQRADAGNDDAADALSRIRGLLGPSPFRTMDEPQRRTDSNFPNTERPVPPAIEDYPPDALSDYWKGLRESRFVGGKAWLQKWAAHWGQTESPSAVLAALVQLHETEEFAECAEIIYDLPSISMGVRKHGLGWCGRTARSGDGMTIGRARIMPGPYGTR